MITYQDARRKMLKYLATLESKDREVAELRKGLTAKEREILGLPQTEEVTSLAIIEDATIADDFGWVFFYQSRAYVDTKDPLRGLVGNAPVIISKSDGSLHVTGTAEPVETYIENFKRSGNPFD